MRSASPTRPFLDGRQDSSSQRDGSTIAPEILKDAEEVNTYNLIPCFIDSCHDDRPLLAHVLAHLPKRLRYQRHQQPFLQLLYSSS